MKQTVLESIVFIAFFIEVIAIIVSMISCFFMTKYPMSSVYKYVKTIFAICIITQTIISVTSGQINSCLLILAWVAGYIIARKAERKFKEENAEVEKCETKASILNLKEQIEKGKVRITDVPFDAVELI